MEDKNAKIGLETLIKQMEFILGVTKTGLDIIDSDYNIRYIDPEWAKVYGDPAGKKCYEYFMGVKEPCSGCGVTKALKTKKPVVTEEVLVREGNRPIQVTTIPFQNEKGEWLVAEVNVDITERKRAEKELNRYRHHLEELVRERTREIVRANKKMKQLSLRDSHTGLYNHRYFMEAIEVEFERARRNGQSLSTMMLDIDYFKSINDVYGHRFGDLILKQFAKQLKGLVRRYDIVIRYGGEEFIIISPGTKRTDALNLARRILDALNLYNFGDKKRTVKLKLSIAIASYPDDNVINGMDLMGLTDQILNMVKEGGGNRVYSSLDMGKKKILSLKESTDVKFMEGKIDRLTKRANQSLVEAIFAFAKTIELKDRYTGEHGERTVQFATSIARELNLSKYETELIRQAAILHDLGKIGISEKILLKKGKLTKEEFDEIKKHPQIAADILRPIQFLHPIIPLILHHHERWDGKGYPHGLKGERIPVGARVLSLADHYQALISDRPYRKAFPKKEAVKIIRKGSGTQFYPKVVDAFLKILKKEK